MEYIRTHDFCTLKFNLETYQHTLMLVTLYYTFETMKGTSEIHIQITTTPVTCCV
jgi:hypothetical protein